jgi:hypothetical protein
MSLNVFYVMSDELKINRNVLRPGGEVYVVATLETGCMGREIESRLNIGL